MTETVNVDRMVVEYAITALRGSGDNGDQYCASQLEQALGRGPLKQIRPFKAGDKVICSRAILDNNKGRKGTVLAMNSIELCVRWDNNSDVSWINKTKFDHA